MTKAPAALIPKPIARTVGFALLALLGATEWARMIDGGGLLVALPWVLAAVLAGETVGAAGSLPPRLRIPAAALAAARRARARRARVRPRAAAARAAALGRARLSASGAGSRR